MEEGSWGGQLDGVWRRNIDEDMEEGHWGGLLEGIWRRKIDEDSYGMRDREGGDSVESIGGVCGWRLEIGDWRLGFKKKKLCSQREIISHW